MKIKNKTLEKINKISTKNEKYKENTSIIASTQKRRLIA